MRQLWLLGVLAFLGAIFWQVYRQDPYFYYSAHQLFLEAQRAQQRGDLPAAVTWARRAVDRSPQWEYRVFLAWRLLETHQPEEALTLFTRLSEERPAESLAWRGRALALEQLGRRAEALELLSRYLHHQPRDIEVLRQAAALAATDPATQEQAVNLYRRLHELQPRDHEIRQHLLDLLLARQEFAAAIPLQEEIVREFPDNANALHQLALLHAWQQDYEAAVPIYEKLLQLEAANQALRLEAARTAEAAQKLDQALTHYLALYRESGGRAEYARALARIWSQKGDHGSAAAVLAPLLASGEASLADRQQHALELLLAGDYRAAFTAYQRLWEGGDTSKETLVNLARLAAHRRQFGLAADLWDETRRRHLILGRELRQEAALTYAYAQRYREAIQILKPVPRDEAKLLFFLGQMHFYQQNYHEAVHYYRRFLEKQPGDSAVRRQLAQTLSLLPESRQAAVEEYDRLLQQQDNPGDRLQKAAVLLQLAQDWAERQERTSRRLAADYWLAAEQELLRLDPAVLKTPEQQRQYYKLLMWLGAQEAASKALQVYLMHQPRDWEARQDQIRLLLYQQRGKEAAARLRELKLAATANQDFPSPKELLALELETALAANDLAQAERTAWQLYLLPLGRQPAPASWRAAYRRLQELPQPPAFSSRERILLSRFLVRKAAKQTEPDLIWLAVDLCLANLQDPELQQPEQRRYYHASLLLLASLLPRLEHFEEVNRVLARLPGVQGETPEFQATLAHFTGLYGRRDGKVQYLLQTLADRRRRQPVQAPGDLLYLAELAGELNLKREALDYLEEAHRLRPQDDRITAWRLQLLEATQEYGQLLQALEEQGLTPATRIALARIYLQRQQYDGAVAVLREITPAEACWPEAQQLLVAAHKGRGDLQAALTAIAELERRQPPTAALLLTKGQILEALNDRTGATTAYQAAQHQGDAYQQALARARLARFRGDWGNAYRYFAAALRERPQEIEILNELEQVRAQMRPYLAARGLPPCGRGERRPEEGQRPWQFGRYDREPGYIIGRRGYPRALLPLSLPRALTPETALSQDRSRVEAAELHLGGGFWLGRLLPVTLAANYKMVHQDVPGSGPPGLNLGLDRVFRQSSRDRTTWHRLEVTLGFGPLILGEVIKLRAEISGRQYWRKMRQEVTQAGQIFLPFPPTLVNTQVSSVLREHETRERLAGGLSATLSPGPQTDLTLGYARRDLFDQEPGAYPRLYQQWTRLINVPLIMMHQATAGLYHQFRPDLELTTALTHSWLSDRNRRWTFYQGFRWQLLSQPRSHLGLTPGYYLALHRRQVDSYFSPHAYHALGVSLDIDRQLYRLPTLVVELTGQGVCNAGRWGPAVAGVVGLEEEPVHNLYLGLHYFFYKEWATDYWLHSLMLGLNWRF